MSTQAEVEQSFIDVPMPAFADDCDVQLDPVGGQHYRVLHGRAREVGPIVVGATAAQFIDGRVDDGSQGDAPLVWIWDSGFSTDHARQLAAALTAAADELDAAVGA